jgi:uncharacterized membrane protein YgcG
MIAYNETWLKNLFIVKEAKRWLDQNLITTEQFKTISDNHKAEFYHPNFFIRILLFLATLIALGGVTGLLGLVLMDILEDAIEVLALLYGLGSWFFLEMVFVRNAKHYKSGVNEALLYHSLGWTIGGLSAMTGFHEGILALICVIAFTFAAIRYADLLCTIGAFGSFAYFVFYEFYSMGGVFQQIIPIVFIAIFTPFYFGVKAVQRKKESERWDACLTLVESLTLMIIYAAGNYFVVREMSAELMGLYLQDGEDIPLAFVFYGLTVIIPVLYLYVGIVKKDVVLLRVSLVAIAFSVFTFKYYFSLGHPEITLTLAGAVLLTVSLYLFKFLKTIRGGFTRENILKEKWADANPEAFVMSQTLGGNKMVEGPSADSGSGGSFGGGGSSEGW